VLWFNLFKVVPLNKMKHRERIEEYKEKVAEAKQ